MLQQTRVETVVPYWETFLARFPTVEALAAAPVDDVLAAWAGLGYYRRARLLHVGAQAVAARGAFPDDVAGLREVPGIGPYTAGALASIAFGRRAALVDGNVERVLARRFGVDLDVRSPEGRRLVWRIAEALVPDDAPGDFNQALMELGATVCTPRRPRCGDCPIARGCVARTEDRAEALPILPARRAPQALALGALVALRGRGASAKVLLGQRRAEGRFGGLWEPPTLGLTEGDGQGVLAPEAAAALGFEGRAVGSFVHVLSHRRLDVTVYVGAARVPRGGPEPFAPYATFAFCSRDELAARGASRLAQRALELAGFV